MKRTEKIKNEFLLKRGAYNITLAVLVIVAIVAAIIFSDKIAENYPTDIDLTTTGENTISDENIEHIKKIDKNVEIIVCADKKGFTSQTMSDEAMSNYGTVFQSGDFFEQAQKLIDDYPKYNDKISVKYIDRSAVSFEKTIEKTGRKDLKYGDIIVYSTFTGKDGKEITLSRVLTVKDLFVTEENYDYLYTYGMVLYFPISSNVETALTGALYNVTREDTKTMGLLTGKTDSFDFTTLRSTVELNAYNVVDIDSKTLTSIPENIDILVIGAPKNDFAAAEIEVIEKFLDNGGEKGKELFVFCDAANPDLPNFYEFLAEWGAQITDGEVLVETDENHRFESSETIIEVVNSKSDRTNAVNNNESIYFVADAVPMKKAYDGKESRGCEVIMNTYDTAASVALDKIGSDEGKKDTFAICIYTNETLYVDDTVKKSGVLVCASSQLLNEYLLSFAEIGNDELFMAAVNDICGRDSTDVAFTQKVVDTMSFLQPTAKDVKVMRIVFVILTPILIMSAGIFVWIRRSRR
ncbi:MAG: hypothetical protein E7550_01690 [Ruminococcaceae bacterium]|nr:hypothetical protein [Oscillospiraceae bacterium]